MKYLALDSTKSPKEQRALASELIKTDDNGSGYDAPMPTHSESTLTRNGTGAGAGAGIKNTLWEKSETTPSDFGNQTSLATLPSENTDEGRPNGTLEQSENKIVWSGRRHLISTEGSNVSGIKDDTFATTTELPINPTVRTEALASTSSAQARETLTDQTTGKIITLNQNRFTTNNACFFSVGSYNIVAFFKLLPFIIYCTLNRLTDFKCLWRVLGC